MLEYAPMTLVVSRHGALANITLLEVKYPVKRSYVTTHNSLIAEEGIEGTFLCSGLRTSRILHVTTVSIT